jgi:hypothetical protein
LIGAAIRFVMKSAPATIQAHPPAADASAMRDPEFSRPPGFAPVSTAVGARTQQGRLIDEDA